MFFFGARGSGQKVTDSYGYGAQVWNVWTKVSATLTAKGYRVAKDYVAYDPNAVSVLLKPTGIYDFVSNMELGVQSAYYELAIRALYCPNERIVLAGYSQGAMVLHRVLQTLIENGDTALLNRIDGIVFLADGDHVKNDNVTPWGNASAAARGVGIVLAFASLADNTLFPSEFAPRVQSVCMEQDTVCDFAAAYATGALAAGLLIHTGPAYLGNSAYVTGPVAAVTRRVLTAPRPGANAYDLTPRKNVKFTYPIKATVPSGYSLNWRLQPGSKMPAGLSFLGSGTISGTPSSTPTGRTVVEVRAVQGSFASNYVPITLVWNGGPPLPGPAVVVMTAPASTTGTLRQDDVARWSFPVKNVGASGWQPVRTVLNVRSGSGSWWTVPCDQAVGLGAGMTWTCTASLVLPYIDHYDISFDWLDAAGSWHTIGTTATNVAQGALTGIDRAVVSSSPLVGDMAQVRATVRNDTSRTLTFNSITMESVDPNGAGTNNFCGTWGATLAPAQTYTCDASVQFKYKGTYTVFPTYSSATTGMPYAGAHLFSPDWTFVVARTPAVTRILPASGAPAGGTTVVLTGVRFASATSVSFGGVAGTSMHVNSDTQITVTAPPGSGTAPVLVNGGDGTSPLSDGSHFEYRSAGPVVRRSVSAAGAEGNGDSDAPSLSADGTKVAFSSAASNLVPADTNGVRDIFVENTLTGSIRRVVSTGVGNTQLTASSWTPDLSGDGTAVAFRSSSPADGLNHVDLSWDDGNAMAIIDYSVAAAALGNSDASNPSVNYDGTKVAFESAATNLSPDTSAYSKIFVRTLRPAYSMVEASTNVAGDPADGDSFDASLSTDGTKVAFASWATNLVPGTPAGHLRIYVKDLTTGLVTRADTAADGTAATGSLSQTPSLSGDGTVVAFTSDATNLVPGDNNNADDVFVKNLSSGQIARASTSTLGQQSDGYSYRPNLAADGSAVTFYSYAANLVPGDNNGVTDVFVKDLITGVLQRPAQPAGAREPDSDTFWSAISGDGSVVAFASYATDLVPGDSNTSEDVFTRAIPVPRRAQNLTVTATTSSQTSTGVFAVTFTVHNSAAAQVCVPYLNAVLTSVNTPETSGNQWNGPYCFAAGADRQVATGAVAAGSWTLTVWASDKQYPANGGPADPGSAVFAPGPVPVQIA